MKMKQYIPLILLALTGTVTAQGYDPILRGGPQESARPDDPMGHYHERWRQEDRYWFDRRQEQARRDRERERLYPWLREY